MGRRTNPEWIGARESDILQKKEIDVTTQYSCMKQDLICLLSKFGVAFTTINLGCGVTRITTKTNVCQKCNGTGKC